MWFNKSPHSAWPAWLLLLLSPNPESQYKYTGHATSVHRSIKAKTLSQNSNSITKTGCKKREKKRNKNYRITGGGNEVHDRNNKLKSHQVTLYHMLTRQVGNGTKERQTKLEGENICMMETEWKWGGRFNTKKRKANCTSTRFPLRFSPQVFICKNQAADEHVWIH